MKETYRTNIRKNIQRRMAEKVIRSSLIYLAVLVFVMGIGYALGHAVIWYGTEPSYYLLHWISEHVILAGYIGFSLGELAILLYYVWKMCGYFQELSDAMMLLYQENPSFIVLSEVLKEMENQMNRTQNQMLASRQQAREAEQRKNDLVVYLAHDLKTPLTSVLGYLMLLEESSGLPSDMQDKYIGIARRKAERLEELINEFFEITRFNLSSMELEMQRINFTRLLEQTIFEFRPMLEEKHLTCNLEAQKDIMLTCDLNKMQRVVDNLLRNGILYGYEGTNLLVTLKKTTKETGAGSVVFTCTNQGPTIPKNRLERIFEQFYRLDSARTSSTGGAGLGLAIAKEIIRLHGGSIAAESQQEVTTFTVELPGESS